MTTPTTTPDPWHCLGSVHLSSLAHGWLMADGSVLFHGFRFTTQADALAAAQKMGY